MTATGLPAPTVHNNQSAETTSGLRHQIEGQRAALARDLETLGDRLSPRRVAARRRATLHQGWKNLGSRSIAGVPFRIALSMILVGALGTFVVRRLRSKG